MSSDRSPSSYRKTHIIGKPIHVAQKQLLQSSPGTICHDVNKRHFFLFEKIFKIVFNTKFNSNPVCNHVMYPFGHALNKLNYNVL